MWAGGAEVLTPARIDKAGDKIYWHHLRNSNTSTIASFHNFFSSLIKWSPDIHLPAAAHGSKHSWLLLLHLMYVPRVENTVSGSIEYNMDSEYIHLIIY